MLADPIDDENITMLSRMPRTGYFTITEHLHHPHRIAHCPHCLIDDDDPSISDLQCTPISRCWYARHIDDDVMELRSQYRKQRVDGGRGDLHIVVQRFLGTEHKQPFTVLRHDAVK